MNPIESTTAPVHVILERPKKATGGSGLISMTISFAPLIIIILASKPALRQAIKLKAAQSAFRFCDWQVETWKRAMMSTGKVYKNAQL
jgi:hypothetical protein